MSRSRGSARGASLPPACRALLCAALVVACGGPPRPEVGESVVLLHGLGRSDLSMLPLENHLSGAGYRVHNLRYESTKHPPETLVEQLDRRLELCCSEAPRLHFVGHSLGGVLVRAYLAKKALPHLGRVVMLAPPNRGSELVDVLRRSPAFAWALGPSAEQLGTQPCSFPNRLPPAHYEVGVIAGTASWNLVGSAMIPGQDDGTVSVDSTKLEGMTDFLLVDHTHSFMMFSDEVAEQVVHFLREGRFVHSGAARGDERPAEREVQ